MVIETFASGASVSGVARRHGVNPSLVFSWRKRMRDELGFPSRAETTPAQPTFLPLFVTDAPAKQVEAPPAAIEIAFACGAQVKITGAADSGLVAAVLKTLAAR